MAVEKPHKWNEWISESQFQDVRQWQEWGWISKDDILEMFFYTPEYVKWMNTPTIVPLDVDGRPF